MTGSGARPKRPSTAPDPGEARGFLLPGLRGGLGGGGGSASGSGSGGARAQSESGAAGSIGTASDDELASSSAAEEPEAATNWGAFIAAYAHGHWDPHRTPHQPRASAHPPAQKKMRIDLSPSSLAPPQLHRTRASLDAPPLSAPPLEERELGPGEAVAAAATMRWAGARVRVAPLALPSPERELLDPLRSYAPASLTQSPPRRAARGLRDDDGLPPIQGSPSAAEPAAPVDDYFSGAHAPASADAPPATPDARAEHTRTDHAQPLHTAPVTSRRPSAARQSSAPLPIALPRAPPPARRIAAPDQAAAREAREAAMYGALGYLAPPFPPDELDRRRALYKFNLWHTPPDANFERIEHLTRLVFRSKIVAVSLIDGGEEWWKAASGTARSRGVRATSFCAHAILQRGDEPMVILDAREDWRFRNNPLVTGAPHIRFYAGAPLRTADGFNVGALAVIDDQPRAEFGARQRHTLKEFAAIAMREMELWRDKIQLSIRDRIQNSMEQFTRECLEIDVEEQAASLNADAAAAKRAASVPPGSEPDDVLSMARLEAGEADEALRSRSQPPLTANDADKADWRPLHAPNSEDGTDSSPAVAERTTSSSSGASGSTAVTSTSKDTGPSTATSAGTSTSTGSSSANPGNAPGPVRRPLAMERVYERAVQLVARTLDVENALILDLSHTEVLETAHAEGTLSVNVHSAAGPRGGGTSRAPATHRLGAAEAARLVEVFERFPDGRVCEGVVPEPLRRFVPPGISYALTVPVFNIDRRPFAMLCAYNMVREGAAGADASPSQRAAAAAASSGADASQAQSVVTGITDESAAAAAERWGDGAPGQLPYHADPGYAPPDIEYDFLAETTGERLDNGCGRPAGKRFLEGHELSYLRAIGVIILSAVLKRRMTLADKAKSLFISNISHELRTPLHGILAAAELLADTPLNHSQLSFLQTVQACATSLVETVNHVLDFTKLSGNAKSGGVEHSIATSRADIMQLVEEAVEGCWIGHRARTSAASADEIGSLYSPPRIDASGKKNHVEVVVEVGERLQGWNLKFEKGGIRRVLMNIFGNSLKFTTDGYVHVILREAQDQADPRHEALRGTDASAFASTPVRPRAPHRHTSTPRSQPRDLGGRQDSLDSPEHERQREPSREPRPAGAVRVELAVVDTGKGISQDFLKNQLFHPFSQENPLQTGTGLGLAIVSSIVQSKGVEGKVDVWSAENVGTEIKVSFMAEPATPTASVSETLVPPMAAPPVHIELIGFDAPHRGVQLLRSVLVRQIVDWWGFTVAPPGVRGDIAIVNESLGPVLEAIRLRDSGRPFVILTSERGDDALMHTVGDYERSGGFCRVLYKPGGPSRLRPVLKLCLHALKIGKSVNGSDAAPSPETSGTHTPEHAVQAPPAVRRYSEDKATTAGPRRPSMAPRSVTAHPVASWNELRGPEEDEEDEAEDARALARTRSLGGSGRSSPTIAVGSGATLLRSAIGTLGSGTRVRVLVVEDNNILRNLLVRWLQSKGYEYADAVDGREGVRLFESAGAFDVVLLDMSMPVLDGVAATAEIRAIERARGTHSPARLLALTGMSSLEDKRRAFEAGVDGYLVKPIAFKTLTEMFARLGVS